MRNSNEQKLAAALADAGDAAGAARLFALLGYEPSRQRGVAARPFGDVSTCRIASGGGIDVHCIAPADALSPAARAARIRDLLGRTPQPVLLVWPGGETLAIASGGLDARPRVLVLSRVSVRASDVDTLQELTVRDEPPLSALSRHARALDRSALTRRFFRDFRAQRDALSAAWAGLPANARADRDQLALLFLSRIVFLYFLQRQGHLLGRPDYMAALVRDAALAAPGRSIFRRVVQPLFFGVLNRPVAERDADACALGPLPYLNGGLFEPHALERRHPELDLPDSAVITAFEKLFERYRFTVADAGRSGDNARAIEPEMLGRMFEGLMAADRRERTGTFYTPAAVVDRVVRQALQGWLAGREGMDWRAAGLLLRERAPGYGADETLLGQVRALRVIDPACGSGAFVLGSLERVARLRAVLGDTADADALRREVAAGALYGVDLEADAALLCALRLWLALTPGAGSHAAVQPLPNLDQRVRQGDALLDPVDLAARGDAAADSWKAAAHDPAVRRAKRLLTALVQAYGSASAGEREALRRRIGRAEVRLARRWIAGAMKRGEQARREVHASARALDLFGQHGLRTRERAQLARLRDARLELVRIERKLRDERALPFFSFALHFGTAGDSGAFDIVVSNPPWVRSHRWPRAFASLIRSRYRVCRDGGWKAPGAGSAARGSAGQVDMALLFVERALDLLRESGVLAMLLPAKAFRTISAGAARALLDERCTVLAIEDHALHHRAIFRGADAFAGVLIARSRAVDAGDEGEAIRVTMTHPKSQPLRFRVRPRQLSLVPGDHRSPWLIVPPDVRIALRRMQRAGPPLGRDRSLAVRRGAMTGANDALLFEHAERKLGDAVVACARSADDDTGPASVLLHTGDVCPVVRGAGIRPFRFSVDGYVAWCHDDVTAAPRAPSRRLARHLSRAEARLRARPGWRAGLPLGAIFRLDDAMLRPRVAWRDIATDLEVTRLPARTEVLGTLRPLVALNTVYFIALDDDTTANALLALFASLPCRVFARSIAERAKDARFRFFAWTIAALPLPRAWRDARCALARLGVAAQDEARAGAVDPATLRAIDDVAADLYGLSPRHARAFRNFDEWLRGRAAAASAERERAAAS